MVLYDFLYNPDSLDSPDSPDSPYSLDSPDNLVCTAYDYYRCMCMCIYTCVSVSMDVDRKEALLKFLSHELSPLKQHKGFIVYVMFQKEAMSLAGFISRSFQ